MDRDPTGEGFEGEAHEDLPINEVEPVLISEGREHGGDPFFDAERDMPPVLRQRVVKKAQEILANPSPESNDWGRAGYGFLAGVKILFPEMEMELPSEYWDRVIELMPRRIENSSPGGSGNRGIVMMGFNMSRAVKEMRILNPQIDLDRLKLPWDQLERWVRRDRHSPLRWMDAEQTANCMIIDPDRYLLHDGDWEYMENELQHWREKKMWPSIRSKSGRYANYNTRLQPRFDPGGDPDDQS